MDLKNKIAEVAYELFERDGRVHGKDQEHWLEAERIVKARYASRVGKSSRKKAETTQPRKPAVKKSPEESKPQAASQVRAKLVARRPKKATRTPRTK